MTSNETVHIDGIAYEVVLVETPESHTAKGRPNTAAAMIAQGHRRDMVLRRLNGRVMFTALENTNGALTKVLRVPGRW